MRFGVRPAMRLGFACEVADFAIDEFDFAREVTGFARDEFSLACEVTDFARDGVGPRERCNQAIARDAANPS
jgi:hypothetical protein